MQLSPAHALPVTEKHLARGARKSPKASPKSSPLKQSELTEKLAAAEKSSQQHMAQVRRLEAELAARNDAEQRVQVTSRCLTIG